MTSWNEQSAHTMTNKNADVRGVHDVRCRDEVVMGEKRCKIEQGRD